MAGDRLRTLKAVRRLAVEQARQALGLCLKAEARGAQRIAALDDLARRDRAAPLDESYRFLDMFADRRAALQMDRRTAADALTTAQAQSAEARTEVAAARTAAEAVEQLIAERDAVARTEAAGREQHALDDIARSRYRASRNDAVQSRS